MNAEFNWWLLIVGVAAGAGLAWLTLSGWGRREEDLEVEERAAEAAWIADVLRDRGEAVDPVEAEEVLALHRVYLQQSGHLDYDDFASGDAQPESDDLEWGTNQWAHEAWDAEVVTPGSVDDRPVAGNVADTAGGTGDAVEAGTGAPATPSRPSIRSGGSVAPRAGADTRQVEPEPPQA